MVTQKAELLQKAWPRWLEPNQQLSCFLTWSQSFFTISSIVVQFLKHQPLEYLQESFAEFMPFQGESRAKAREWVIRNLKTRDRNNTSHHSQWIFFLKNNYIHFYNFFNCSSVFESSTSRIAPREYCWIYALSRREQSKSEWVSDKKS